MGEILHTFIGSRHYPHKNNTPKAGWVESIKKSASIMQEHRPSRVKNASLFWSDEARTIGAGIQLANALNVRIDNFQIRDWLCLKPKHSPKNVKDILEKIDEYYEIDPDVKEHWYSDKLIYKIQRNTLDGVDVRPFARFTTNKLYNIIQYIKRNPKDSNFSIPALHGGWFLEIILYTLWWENMPKEWEWQLRMSEPFAMHVEKDPEETDKVVLVVHYRGESRTIKEDKIKDNIDALR